MYHFPYVKLPDYFTRLLKMNVNRETSYDFLVEEFRNNASLKSLVEGIIREDNNIDSAERIFRSRGWGNTNGSQPWAGRYQSTGESGWYIWNFQGHHRRSEGQS